MIGSKVQKYLDLEHESSNRMLEHDSRRVLGRYKEAVYHALRAGMIRDQMGQRCYAAENYAEAAEDWLSAVECFLLASATKEAADVLGSLHRLETEGKILAERPDLVSALRKCELLLKE